ncbi:MAG: MmgE/PrpD family protein [Chloroflexi bacterium]|nr:MmgE/PrpD family protein [Chloroflexota bacterium]
MGPTEQLAEYVVKADFKDFPGEVVAQGKWCILDPIVCALGGIQTEVGQRHLATALDFGGKPEATLVGSDTKITAAFAAHFNAELANVLDFDDSYKLAQSHPGGPIVFSALAVGESVGASGRDIITAVIAGYEVAMRVARAIRSIVDTPSGRPDVLSNMTYYVFGAAAAAAKLLGLDTERTINAFGIAGSTPVNAGQTGTVSVGKAFKFHDIKYNQGLYAFVGTFAALRARRLSGPEGVLDGDSFWKCCGANTCDHTELTRELGRTYRIMDMSFKPMCACGWTQAPVTAVWKALEGASVNPADIEEIKLFGLPKLMRYEWQTMQEAQFSTPCAVALAVAGPPAGPAWYTTGRYREPDIIELARKVNFFEDPAAWEPHFKYGKKMCSTEIKLKGGRVLRAHVDDAKGSPGENAFTAGDFRQKFMNTVPGTLGDTPAEALWQTLTNLEKVEKIGDMTGLLAPG